ncbi:hypothetical protein LPL18_011445 [Halomonas sp. CUBES01]|uniref:hypothetical protein n=1 Tax=Halomonas sp. CUBES01 TaxID=2897340 RepID=UPI001E45D3C3|nr:hypothetical protein [Halomonas sp. CUBES01]MEC4767939.1 hypothetical protein [Halomonas sp. CUBES01]
MSGKLGSAALVADTTTTVYTVPADTVATLNISLVNRGTEPAKVRVAITDAAEPGDADWIEYGAEIPEAGGVLERTALVAGAGEKIIILSDVGNISARVHGFEEAE